MALPVRFARFEEPRPLTPVEYLSAPGQQPSTVVPLAAPPPVRSSPRPGWCVRRTHRPCGGPCSTLGERGVESRENPRRAGPGVRVPRSPKNSMRPGRNPVRRRHGSEGVALDPTMMLPLEFVDAVSPMPFRTWTVYLLPHEAAPVASGADARHVPRLRVSLPPFVSWWYARSDAPCWSSLSARVTEDGCAFSAVCSPWMFPVFVPKSLENGRSLSLSLSVRASFFVTRESMRSRIETTMSNTCSKPFQRYQRLGLEQIRHSCQGPTSNGRSKVCLTDRLARDSLLRYACYPRCHRMKSRSAGWCSPTAVFGQGTEGMPSLRVEACPQRYGGRLLDVRSSVTSKLHRSFFLFWQRQTRERTRTCLATSSFSFVSVPRFRPEPWRHHYQLRRRRKSSISPLAVEQSVRQRRTRHICFVALRSYKKSSRAPIADWR
jgi:hypothetical protein